VLVSFAGDAPAATGADVGDGPQPLRRSGGGLPQLRGYQVRAVDAIIGGLAAGGRGQLVAACGSGKSLVAVHAALRLCPDGVVVLACPSLALVAQSLRVWVGAEAAGDVLAVCSDDTVADAAVHAADLPCPVTTDAAEVAEWLRLRPAGRLRLILVTHVSAGVAGAGLAKADTVADLLVVDEAHRTAGAPGKTFAQVHEDGFVAARRRLYMTATPRLLAAGRRGPPWLPRPRRPAAARTPTGPPPPPPRRPGRCATSSTTSGPPRPTCAPGWPKPPPGPSAPRPTPPRPATSWPPSTATTKPPSRGPPPTSSPPRSTATPRRPRPPRRQPRPPSCART
jgi:hypothetical protein